MRKGRLQGAVELQHGQRLVEAPRSVGLRCLRGSDLVLEPRDLRHQRLRVGVALLGLRLTDFL